MHMSGYQEYVYLHNMVCLHVKINGVAMIYISNKNLMISISYTPERVWYPAVWNAVCNKNPLLFPLQITLLSNFITLFPQEIRMLLFPWEIRVSLFPREIRVSLLFPREIRNAFISSGNKKIFSEASPAK